MRSFVYAMVALLVPALPAAAADMDILRGPLPVAPAPLPVGPATFTRWSGFYAGGQFGLSNANADFSGSTAALVAYSLRDTTLENEVMPSSWPVLGTANQSQMSYGGFIGYNTQWQDLVLGLEINYSHASFNLNAPTSPIGRTTSDSTGSAYVVNITGNGNLTAANFGTFRLRAGWVTGDFLPYAFLGAALGVASSSVSSTVSGVQYTSGVVGTCPTPASCVPFSYTNSFGANNEVLYGFTVGGGVDYAIMSNVFLRAEFEWDQFKPPPGFLATIATGRVGGGFKF